MFAIPSDCVCLLVFRAVCNFCCEVALIVAVCLILVVLGVVVGYWYLKLGFRVGFEILLLGFDCVYFAL